MKRSHSNIRTIRKKKKEKHMQDAIHAFQRIVACSRRSREWWGWNESHEMAEEQKGRYKEETRGVLPTGVARVATSTHFTAFLLFFFFF